MISDIILGISLIGSLSLVGLLQYFHAKERKDLIRAVLSKNLTEVTQAEAVDKIPNKEEPKPPDLEPLSELDDDRFAAMIAKQNKIKS